jgi:hypothetical protein
VNLVRSESSEGIEPEPLGPSEVPADSEAVNGVNDDDTSAGSVGRESERESRW